VGGASEIPLNQYIWPNHRDYLGFIKLAVARLKGARSSRMIPNASRNRALQLGANESDVRIYACHQNEKCEVSHRCSESYDA
jgi:hypothetical protein